MIKSLFLLLLLLSFKMSFFCCYFFFYRLVKDSSFCFFINFLLFQNLKKNEFLIEFPNMDKELTYSLSLVIFQLLKKEKNKLK